MVMKFLTITLVPIDRRRRSRKKYDSKTPKKTR
jgi:hypothetical protein